MPNLDSRVEAHYAGSGDLAARIRGGFEAAGLPVEELTTHDLAPVDEFHIRGREATLELGRRMEIGPDSYVLDVGCGLGGPARTLAETWGCRVTGIDLTRSFCDAGAALSEWLGLAGKVRLVHGDATDLPFEADSFDAAMTIHAAMNIAAKDALYAGVRRVLKPGSIFAVYDVLQGEGGEVRYPVPWARDAATSHLVGPAEMRRLLTAAGFEILEEIDSSEQGLAWFRDMMGRMTESPPPVTFQSFLGTDFPHMARNQVQNLAERRIRVVTFICRA